MKRQRPIPTYLKRLIGLSVVFMLFYACFCIDEKSQNTPAFVGVVMIGAYIVPITLLSYFYEKQSSLRNAQSVWNAVWIGMAVSVTFVYCFTYLLDYGVYICDRNHWGYMQRVYERAEVQTGCSVLIEECARLLTIVLLVHRIPQATRSPIACILTGMAVGAGFAGFETMSQLIETPNAVLYNLLTRGVFTSASHFAWGGLMGAAVSIYKQRKTAFWFSVVGIILLHFVWNIAACSEVRLWYNTYQVFIVNFAILVIVWRLVTRKAVEKNV